MRKLILPSSQDYLKIPGIAQLVASEHVYVFEKEIHETLKSHPNVCVGRQLFESKGQKMVDAESIYYQTPSDILDKFLSFNYFGCIEREMTLIPLQKATIRWKSRLGGKQYAKIIISRPSQNESRDFVIVYHFGSFENDVKNFLDELVGKK